MSQSVRRGNPWQRLKKKWNRRGVVEIEPDDSRNGMLACIRDGIRDVITKHSELGPKDTLDEGDCSHVFRTTMTTTDGQTFAFASYASSVFASIRRAIDVSEVSYLQSMAPGNLPYLEFISNSKSGQNFYLTNDMQYFLKTEKKYYVDYFLSILEDYLYHFLEFPHSLLVKFLGMYSVKLPGQTQKYFLVMQSIFYPGDRLEDRFDLKGCFAGRYQSPPEEGSEVITVLKDQNFKSEEVKLGSQRDWFIRQIEADVNFLRDLGVIDYSLLVGRHTLHVDEQTESFSNLVLRVQKSLHDPTAESPGKSQASTPSPKKAENGAEEFEMQAISPPGTVHEDSSADENKNKQLQQCKKHVVSRFKKKVQQGSLAQKPTLMSLTNDDYLDSIGATGNRRLLLNCKNALHIINGNSQRYYLGIIDFFTLYEYHQKLDRVRKSTIHFCGDHSTLPPGEYADRFRRFISEHTS